MMRLRNHGGYGLYARTTSVTVANRTYHPFKAHQGWDLLAPPGTPAYAVADGWAKSGRQNDYGLFVCLRFLPCEDYLGTLWALYAHLSAAWFPHSWKWVAEGTKLGLTGMSGMASTLDRKEAHLHFEISTCDPTTHARGSSKSLYWTQRFVRGQKDKTKQVGSLRGTADPAKILGSIGIAGYQHAPGVRYLPSTSG